MKGRKLIALIVLGFACCGFSFEFEFVIMPFVYLAVALLAWRFRRKTPGGGQTLEAILLAIGVPGSYMVSNVFGWGPHPLIFVANSLCLYQLFRLGSPMTTKQKGYALTIATLHLAVATFVIVDWKFVVVLLLGLYLVPGAMMEVEAAKYHSLPGINVRSGSWKYVLITGVLMIIFFIGFPRIGRMRRINPARMLGTVQPPQEINMTETTGAGSDVKIMQVEGERLGYMKSFAMDVFDGTTWKVGLWGSRADGLRLKARGIAKALPRTVKVLNYPVLRERLPIDGYVVDADVPTSNRFYISENGGMKCNRAFKHNYTYRYWSHVDEPLPWHPLNARVRKEFLKLGGFEPSDRLKSWVAGIIQDQRDPESIARRLEQHFQIEFTYQLGVPTLSRLAPMDDFIFNEKRGHCERYASALALLLRMQGVPSRVVIGYVPREYNDIGDFYTIRDNNRHAWTEAWIPNKGWVIFDATPAGTSRSLLKQNIALSIYEWAEYTWYSKVVEFDIYKQNDMQHGLASYGAMVIFWLKALKPVVYGLLGLAIWGYIIYLALKWWTQMKGADGDQQESVRQARLFYGQLLSILEKKGVTLTVGQTPNEFVQGLAADGFSGIDDVRLVTQLFCTICYGGRPYTRECREKVRDALKNIG